MYPETDVPPVKVSSDRLNSIKIHLPKMPEELARELSLRYGLGSKLAAQVVDSEYSSVFEDIAANSKIAGASYVATVLTELLKSLEREKVPVENIDAEQLKAAFELVERQVTAKESVPEILKWLAYHPDQEAAKALSDLNLKMLTRAEIEAIVKNLASQNKAAPIGRLTNLVMGEVRGRADPKLVVELLRLETTRANQQK